MHVDDGRRKVRDEIRRKNLHVARQHHQFDIVTAEQFELPRSPLLNASPPLAGISSKGIP